MLHDTPWAATIAYHTSQRQHLLFNRISLLTIVKLLVLLLEPNKHSLWAVCNGPIALTEVRVGQAALAGIGGCRTEHVGMAVWHRQGVCSTAAGSIVRKWCGLSMPVQLGCQQCKLLQYQCMHMHMMFAAVSRSFKSCHMRVSSTLLLVHPTGATSPSSGCVALWQQSHRQIVLCSWNPAICQHPQAAACCSGRASQV
jgi:hypothetical protein